MAAGGAGDFRKDAVRIALTSGLSRRQVADDLEVGVSALNKWVNAHRDTDVVSAEDRELARENERLRREIRILKDLPGSGNSPGDCLPAVPSAARIRASGAVTRTPSSPALCTGLARLRPTGSSSNDMATRLPSFMPPPAG